MKKLSKFLSSDWTLGVIIFVVALLIRLIPEVVAGKWPIGYDTYNAYAAELTSYSGSLLNWVRTANILYFLFLPLKALGISADFIMKIYGPIIFGSLVVSFYYFLRKFLKFNLTSAALISFLTIFQFAALRLSWDLYRNELSLVFFFIALTYLPEISKTKNLIYFSILSLLVVLSNQLVTAMLFVVLLVYLIYLAIKKRWEELISLLIPLFLMAALFSMVLGSSGQLLYDSHIIFTPEKNNFYWYFYRYTNEMTFSLLKENISSLFWLLYGILIPTAVIGLVILRKNIILWTITLWLLFGTFSSLLFAGTGLIVWERWMFMLIFPIIIYSVTGFIYLGKQILRISGPLQRSPQVIKLLSVLIWVIVFGFFAIKTWPFLVASYKDAKPPLANEELNRYFPRTMVHNSIGFAQIEETIDAINYLNTYAPKGSLILVDNRYRGLMLTNFELDDRYIVTNSWSDNINTESLQIARQLHFRPVFLIWNNSRAIDGFDRVYSVGSRGIYMALPEFYE